MPFCVFTNGTVKTPEAVRRRAAAGRLPGARRRGADPGHLGYRGLPSARAPAGHGARRQGNHRAARGGGHRGAPTAARNDGGRRVGGLVPAGAHLRGAGGRVLRGLGRGECSTAPPSRRSSPPRRGGRWARPAPSAPSSATSPAAEVTVVGQALAAGAADVAARHLGVPAAELAVVGDDPELEVPMAHKGRRARRRRPHRDRSRGVVHRLTRERASAPRPGRCRNADEAPRCGLTRRCRQPASATTRATCGFRTRASRWRANPAGRYVRRALPSPARVIRRALLRGDTWVGGVGASCRRRAEMTLGHWLGELRSASWWE